MAPCTPSDVKAPSNTVVPASLGCVGFSRDATGSQVSNKETIVVSDTSQTQGLPDQTLHPVTPNRMGDGMNGMNVEGNSKEGEKGKKNEAKGTKQPRRGSKQRLKETEQEQQLTLARSVISNLERKVS